MAIQNLLWGLGQPFAGAIADRYGAGRVLAAGGAVYAVGIAADGAEHERHDARRHGRRAGRARALRRLVHDRARRLRAARAARAAARGRWASGPPRARSASSCSRRSASRSSREYGPVTALLLLSGFVALVPLLALALTGRGSEEELAGEPEVVDPRGDPRGARAPELRAAHLRLLRLRLPHRVHQHAPAALPHRPRLQRRPGRLGARADRAVQRDRRLLVGRPRRIPQQAAAAERHLLRARGRCSRCSCVGADDAVVVLVFAAAHGAAVAVDRAADLGPRRGDVRHAPRRDAVRLRLPLPPGRRLHRRLARRRRSTRRTGAYDLMWWLSIALGLAAAIVHLPISERRAPRWAPSPA